MTDPDPIILTDELVTTIAMEAQCHPNSVLRRFAGLEVSGKERSRRIDEALAKHGIRPEVKR